MEGNVLTGNMLSGISSGMLDMEMSLQHHQHQHQHQHQHHQHPHHPLVNHHMQAMLPHSAGSHVSTGHDAEQSLALAESKGMPKNFMVCSKGKPNTSDEDEPSFTEDGNDSHLSGGKSKKNSPWQRMKWSDSMVRLLITMVSYVGDDGALECNDVNKKKSGILQKKGKWKSVSRAMMDKGCFVSPQQCEDKFNDLNKRYKRLNDILGRGIACRVVENPTLLDSMDHLSAKFKDDVRKLLSSKHLFFKEMCAYHNGQTMHFPPDLDFQQCLQSSLSGKNREGPEACRMTNEENGDDEEDEENDEDDDEDDEDNDDENGEDADAEGMGNYSKRRKMSRNPEEVNFWSAPATHDCGKPSGSYNLNAEMASVLQDSTKTAMEQKLWMRNRSIQLEEQKVNYQAQAFELEKQRFKWQRISSKKLRELERMKLENERMKLENERMALQLKQKELEIEFKRSETSTNSVSLLLEKFQGREQNELGRGQQV
ncbi:uncharacterized protein LOC131035280 [Cryptomeria japonica]|uniref:uncharacterized protein LOC131035280 n=1 Tax=Cryptomeria japonica TaxID=3369 RepID=UPI0027DA827B|nr:uncharacterized protein LOC131035280 [Cryptomeria japonica]XP_057822938.2 uncharacterized protein LOC131035280 [Cryptomeria japonica]